MLAEDKSESESAVVVTTTVGRKAALAPVSVLMTVRVDVWVVSGVVARIVVVTRITTVDGTLSE